MSYNDIDRVILTLRFINHDQLDSHVITEGDKLSIDDLEFCELHYQLFHTWSTNCQSENKDWSCKEECRLSKVQDMLAAKKKAVLA